MNIRSSFMFTILNLNCCNLKKLHCNYKRAKCIESKTLELCYAWLADNNKLVAQHLEFYAMVKVTDK